MDCPWVADLTQSFSGMNGREETGSIQRLNERIDGAVILQLPQHQRCPTPCNEVFVVIADGHDEGAQGIIATDHAELHYSSTAAFFVKAAEVTKQLTDKFGFWFHDC